MSPQFNTNSTENLRTTKICKQESEAFDLDFNLGSHKYEDVIFNFNVTFEMALSEVIFIHFT